MRIPSAATVRPVLASTPTPPVTPEASITPALLPALLPAPVPPAAPAIDPAPGFWEIAGSVGTAIGAVIALAAAGVAIWGAWIARGARDATLSQASTAKEALDDQRAERYERAAPTFEVSIDRQTQVRPAGARIRMLTGPRRISVTIEWQVRFTWLDPGEGRPGDRTAEVEWSGVYSASLCKGATLVVFSDERPESTLIRALAEYKIKSVDQDDTERTWRDEHMTGWALDTLDPADPTTMPPAQAPESP